MEYLYQNLITEYLLSLQIPELHILPHGDKIPKKTFLPPPCGKGIPLSNKPEATCIKTTQNAANALKLVI